MFKTSRVEAAPCSTGMQQPLAAVLACLFGVVFVLIETKNLFVRFCAVQSMLICTAFIAGFIALSILGNLPLIGILFIGARALLSLATAVALGFLAFNAYQGIKVEIPYVAPLAEEWSQVDN